MNVDTGDLMDAAEAGILDHVLIKEWQVRLGKKWFAIFPENFEFRFPHFKMNNVPCDREMFFADIGYDAHFKIGKYYSSKSV